MSEFDNNDKNPFDEQDNFGGNKEQSAGGADPYNRPIDNNSPYSQAPSQGQYMQDIGSPYGQPQQQNPYMGQQGAYGRPNVPPPQGYYQSPYGTQYRPYQPAQNMSTGMATASLVLGIVSICMGLFMLAYPPLFLVPIIGLILGIVFKCKHLPVGKGMSTAGIITSVIGLILPIAFIIMIVALMLNNPELMNEVMDRLKVQSPDIYEEYYRQFSQQFPEWFDGAMKFFGKYL